MKEKLSRIGKKLASKLLLLLGFSTTFVFMACYGTPPQGYQMSDIEEIADSLVENNNVVNTRTDSSEAAQVSAADQEN